MRHKKTIIPLVKILFVLIFTAAGSPLMAEGDIYAVGCFDNYPYEYLNEDGIPSGFSVDIIKSIAGELNIKCRIELVPYERFIHLQKNTDVDIILGMIRGDSNSQYHFFKPNMKIHFSIFANSNSSITSISDLQNSKIAITAHDSIAHPVSNELKKVLKFKPVIINNDILAFTSLKKNQFDAVFMSGSSVRRITANSNLIGIKELSVSAGFFDYGFGIRKGNAENINYLKDGYDRIFASGEYGKIYKRWLVPAEDENFFSETGICISGAVFGFIIFIVFLVINSLILRKRIKEKTENLDASLSELNRMQVLLKESEKRFKRIFHQSPSALMILNSSGRVLMFNNAVVDIFGVNNPDELINLDVMNSPVSTEWFKTRLKNCHSINMEIKFNFEIIRKTGYYSTNKTGVMILELIIMPVEIHTGSPDPGYICQFNDNTQERLLLEEIKYNQNKLEMIFEGIKDGLWEWNILSGKVRYNRKFFSFLGYKPELYPDNISTLFGFIRESEREYVKKELLEKVINGRSFNIEYGMVMNNGKVINVRSKGETIEWDDNLKPLRVIGVQSEISAFRNISNRINLFNNVNENIFFPAAGCAEDRLNNKTILMVDDNYLIFLHVSELLKRYKTETIYASSGSDAIEIFRSRNDIRLIVLDYHMPGLDGVSVLKELHQIDDTVPVIVQTGEFNESVIEHYLSAGFSGVLGKPVEENKLIELICSLIN